jgi:hypothetical protein
VAHSRRQRRGAHGKQLRACSVGPAGTNGSDAVRKGRFLTRPSGWSAQATVHEAEGALGDGRRPGPAEAVVFDEAAADGGPGGTAARSSVSSWKHVEEPGNGGGSRQRASEVTSRSRFAADNAVAGRRSTEELPIEAPPGPCGALFLTSDRGFGSGHRSGLGRRRWLKLEGRRQATLHPKVRFRESDGPCRVHVVVSRLQKSERSIFLRGRRHAAPRARVARRAGVTGQAGQPRG